MRKDTMIYLQNDTTSQEVMLPKTMAVPEGQLVFKAVSTVEKEVEIQVNVEDLMTSELYFHLEVTLPGCLPDGEYQYTLSAGEEVLATGLLQVGDYDHSPDQYNRKMTYEQYETSE